MCDIANPAGSRPMPSIPLSVPSRLEEDSVPNYIECHMQPDLHQQPLMHQPLVGRCWVPPADDELVARKDKAQPLATTVNGKKRTPDLELSDDVNSQAPVDTSHVDGEDSSTQTGKYVTF